MSNSSNTNAVAIQIDDNKRAAARLARQPDHAWQLRVEDDLLITRNITDLSATGLSFKAPASSSFETGQLLRINFAITKDEGFECHAKIKWVKAPAAKMGSMKQFGASFINLPAKYDALITREIFDSQIKEHRRSAPTVSNQPVTAPCPASLTVRSVVQKVFTYAVVTLMVTALVSAIWIHKVGHPEESIATIFNKALSSRQNVKLQPRSLSSD